MTRKKKLFLFAILHNDNDNNRRLHLGRSLQQKSSLTTKLNQDWSSVRSIRNQHNSKKKKIVFIEERPIKALEGNNHIFNNTPKNLLTFQLDFRPQSHNPLVGSSGPLLSILTLRLRFRFSLSQIQYYLSSKMFVRSAKQGLKNNTTISRTNLIFFINSKNSLVSGKLLKKV